MDPTDTLPTPVNYATPAQLEQMREYARSLQSNILSPNLPMPVKNPLGIINALVQGGVAGATFLTPISSSSSSARRSPIFWSRSQTAAASRLQVCCRVRHLRLVCRAHSQTRRSHKTRAAAIRMPSIQSRMPRVSINFCRAPGTICARVTRSLASRQMARRTRHRQPRPSRHSMPITARCSQAMALIPALPI